MKLFRKSVVIFLVFMLGTMALIHVDRQCAQMEKTTADIAEEVENCWFVKHMLHRASQIHPKLSAETSSLKAA